MTRDNHDEKVNRLIKEAGVKGVDPYTVAPPLFRFLWTKGLRVRPPLFLNSIVLVFLVAVFYACPVYLLSVYVSLIPWRASLVWAVGTGLVYGVYCAVTTRRTRKRLGLPKWDEYGR